MGLSRRCWTLLALLSLTAQAQPLTAQPQLPEADPGQWRVLLVYSFGREFAPFVGLSAAFREQLATRSARPIEFYEVTLDGSRRVTVEETDDAALGQYLRGRFARDHPDLVVTFGGPAARFLLRNRSVLFPATPLLIGGTDVRMLGETPPGPLDAVIGVRLDPRRVVEALLAVRPNTRHLMVVLGASAHERRWLQVFQDDLAGLESRISFIWTNDLTLEQIGEVAGAMPADGAILYGMVSVDAAGMPYEQDRALRKVVDAATVPVFGMFRSQFGDGIVGGPLFSAADVGSEVAASALRILAGQAPSSTPMRAISSTRLLYDWRELKRWGIAEGSLPPGSQLEFRPTTLWEQHADVIVGAIVVFLLQAGFILALVAQRSRRRRAEGEARALNQRLLSAHEDEKRRLARELHDDFSHRLARLSIDAAQLERGTANTDVPQIANALRGELAQLSEDIHAVSHSLHPSVLEDLGLVDALRTEGNFLSRLAEVDVIVEADNVPRDLPADVALCAFRVAQEAMRNIGRHAKAGLVRVSLQTRDDRLCVSVSDDGVGFDVTRSSQSASVGHASMRERVLLLGGDLQIRSTPGEGTTIETLLPLNLATS
jgi:signal transduction histidine kinase